MLVVPIAVPVLSPQPWDGDGLGPGPRSAREAHVFSCGVVVTCAVSAVDGRGLHDGSEGVAAATRPLVVWLTVCAPLAGAGAEATWDGVAEPARTVVLGRPALGPAPGLEPVVAEGAGADDDWTGAEQGLTRRESEILALICTGLSNAEIAKTLFLSINSVKTYIRSCYRRIDVRSRSQAVLWGLDHGFVPR